MRFRRMFVNSKSRWTTFLLFISGVYIGLNSSKWVKENFIYPRVKRCSFSSTGYRETFHGRPRPRSLSDELPTKQLLLAGIMTAEKFLTSRATAVYNTWGKTLPGKIVFFAGNRTGRAHKLPLVSLNGVDDRYPPQRKSLMMLKYMHDNYIDKYEWFMRCDDDVYIRTDKLKDFLGGFNSSEDLFVGQCGVGARGERGRLGLRPGDNFCMGGPGVIMSRSVLKKIAPHLQHCFENMVSTHEDVEVGRCVRKHAGVSCTWAFEMQWLFYHNQSKANAFHWDLDTKAVQSAITLHPVKDPKYMYRLHSHFLMKRIQAIQRRSVLKAFLLSQLDEVMQKNPPTNKFLKIKEAKDLHFNVPTNTTQPWEVFNPKKLYTTTVSSPTLPVDNLLKRGLNVILRNSLAMINEESRKVIFRELVLDRVNLGYMRVSPTVGVQYVLDLRMITYQHLGFSRRRLPLKIRYTAHMQQLFGNLVYRSSFKEASPKPYVNIVLPLAGRLDTFAKFLSNFEKVVLMNNEKVKLLIMYFKDVARFENHRKLLKIYAEHYPDFEVIWRTVQGPFSRGLALHLGVAHFSPNSLLFFCDVDLAFDVEFLERCRRNTVKGRRVYYPIIFSQFNQSIGHLNVSASGLDGARGFWRKYGFGIVCACGEDVISVGGFDTNIKGWGLEDVNLYEKFVSGGRYAVMRTPDPGLIHLHHASSCSNDLDPKRLQMCKASAVSQLASVKSLVEHMERKGHF